MSIKKLLAASALIAFAAPAFAQEPVRVTAAQCVELGGTVNQVEGTCSGVTASSDELAGFLGDDGLGAGAVAAAGVLIVLALDSDSSTTTTTTGTGS